MHAVAYTYITRVHIAILICICTYVVRMYVINILFKVTTRAQDSSAAMMKMKIS